MPSDSHYLQLADDGESSSLSTVQEFLFRCLLGAREEASRPSNDRGYDEDVNVYVAGLLEAFLSPAYHERMGRYYFARDLDLAREVGNSSDERFRYRVYRTNADHLLLAIGLFQHVEGASRPHQPLLHREPAEFIGRGGTYYRLASSTLRRLRRRQTGPEQAMEKLAARFSDYVEILRRLRMSYFHLTARLSEAELFHLMQAPGEGTLGDADSDIATLYDRFLDCYSEFKRQPAPQSLEALREAVAAVEQADPDFSFQMPSLEEEPS